MCSYYLLNQSSDNILRSTERCECKSGTSQVGNRCLNIPFQLCGTGNAGLCNDEQQCLHGHCYSICNVGGVCPAKLECSNGS